jgi:hypothetical protein
MRFSQITAAPNIPALTDQILGVTSNPRGALTPRSFSTTPLLDRPDLIYWRAAKLAVSSPSLGQPLLLSWKALPITVAAPVVIKPRLSMVLVAQAIQLAGQSGPNVSINFASATDAGSLVGAITVTTNATSTYVGTISIGGTDAAKLSLSSSSNVSSAAYPCSLYVAQSNIAAGSYVITLTATP